MRFAHAAASWEASCAASCTSGALESSDVVWSSADVPASDTVVARGPASVSPAGAGAEGWLSSCFIPTAHAVSNTMVRVTAATWMRHLLFPWRATLLGTIKGPQPVCSWQQRLTTASRVQNFCRIRSLRLHVKNQAPGVCAAQLKAHRDVDLDERTILVGEDAAMIFECSGIMTEDDVKLALQDPLVAVGTDSGALAEDGPLSHSKSHPRGWGSFPRILGKYVREEHLLSLEAAIHKMTARPAARVGLAERGLLRAGMLADITVFDPATIHDVATFEDPNHYSVGVKWVLVNGHAVVADGKITNERPGRALRGPGYRK